MPARNAGTIPVNVKEKIKGRVYRHFTTFVFFWIWGMGFFLGI